MYFTGNDGYQNFLVFVVFLVLDSNEKVTDWISTTISSEKIKPLDTNLELSTSNLAIDKSILKFNNSALVQKIFSSLHSTFILNLYVVCELNIWPRNPTK